MKPAYIVTITEPAMTRQIIVFGKRAGQQQLALQKRLNPTAVVTLTAETGGKS